MTMPNEPTPAFIQTRDFLGELAQDPARSASIRRQARQLLWHYALIHQLSVHEPVDWLCKVFEVTRSCYHAQRLRRRTRDVERLRLRKPGKRVVHARS